MNATDKRDGLSKSGSGRVGMFHATRLTHIYTMECNYNEGSGKNGRRPVKYTPDIW